MWELHKLLKNGLEGTHQEYLIDEVSSMLDKISGYSFQQSLRLMFHDTVSLPTNPVQLVTLFISGLKKNEVFFFADVVEGLKHGRSARG